MVPNSSSTSAYFLGEGWRALCSSGPSMDKRKVQGLVEGTKWDGFLELGPGWPFQIGCPGDSESRALGVAMRLIRKHYPHIEWVISFADGAQCGDGAIYRAGVA